MHRQRGSEGSLGCLYRQIGDIHKEVKRTDLCTGSEMVRRVTGLSTQTDK